MKFLFVLLSMQKGKIRLKCFYGPEPTSAEFYVTFDLVQGLGEFAPKEGYKAEVLSQAFAKAMAG